MEFKNKTLCCCECKSEFVFSAGEQQFFCQRNLTNTPRRCPGCRLALRFARLGQDVSQLSDVLCAECGKATKVPFRPRGHRPIYCNDCMAQKRISDAAAVELTEATTASMVVPAVPAEFSLAH